MSLYADQLFAPLDLDLHLERIAGGNETEVYRTDDHRFVVKVKSDQGGTAAEALAHARSMQRAAEEFAVVLGPAYTIPSYHLIARDSAGQVQVIVVQPYIRHARPLFEVDYSRLSPTERRHVADQLEDIIRRALNFYRQTGRMPDLYGRISRSKNERRLLNTPRMLLWRLWGFLVKRHLLRSHNLLLTDAPERRIVLIDYDALRQGWLYQLTYYTVRQLLFLRDWLLIQRLRRSGKVSKGN
jgi:hypothetical protein